MNDKFKVIGVDTFSHDDFEYGIYNSLEEAIKAAKSFVKGQQMLKAYIEDEKGHCIDSYGTF